LEKFWNFFWLHFLFKNIFKTFQNFFQNIFKSWFIIAALYCRNYTWSSCSYGIDNQSLSQILGWRTSSS
jgi:hypothetical protein